VIFVTVGTQKPFDRMVSAVDAWAKARGRVDVFAQIGAGAKPEHIRWARDLAPAEFKRQLEEADAIVAHAGMGTILSALSMGKPVLVLPRRASLGEHRNEHQLATTERFEALGKVTAVWETEQMLAALDQLDSAAEQERLARFASPDLLKRLQAFLSED
jgi:UDP-N-acetylglucosamine transferase subunit ALG13